MKLSKTVVEDKHGMLRLEAVDEVDFQWGQKRRVGAKEGVQFYESFTYDGVEYSLFDCVYMWRCEQAEPEIGVIVKIYETPNYVKKVKVVWFFRPSDISNFLGDDKPFKNEIFLASGEGKGLANLNPLLAIAGKCNVVCTSKNKVNPQASDAELRMADFIFYRTFDVGTCMLSDNFPDKIAGIEVECFYNKKKDQNSVPDPKFKQNSKEGDEKESSFSKLDLDEKVGIDEVRNWRSSRSTSTENHPLKKRKLLSDVSDSALKLPSNVSVPKRDEGSIGNITQTSDIGFKDTLNKLSDPRPRLSDCKEEAFDDKTLCSPNSGPRSLASTENHPLKKRKLLSDVSDSVLKLPSNVLVSKRDEGSIANITQTSDIGFKDTLTKLSDPRPRLPDCKEKAFDDKTLCSPNSGLCMGVIEKACDISHKSCSLLAKDKGVKPQNQPFEVTRRSSGGTKRWFKQLPWEQRMKNAHEQGTLVFIENLDPSYTSSEVEDIIMDALNEKVGTKMIERSSFSSPHSGKAFVIFKSKVAADAAINDLDRRCLLLPNGRPLVAYKRTPTEPDKAAKFVGHLELDRTRLLKQQKEKRDAVATSHCSQANNIEYDLGVKWCCLQEQSDAWWKALHKKQESEIRELKRHLKNIPNEQS